MVAELVCVGRMLELLVALVEALEAWVVLERKVVQVVLAVLDAQICPHLAGQALAVVADLADPVSLAGEVASRWEAYKK